MIIMMVQHKDSGEKHIVHVERSRSGFGLTLTLWQGEEEVFITHTASGKSNHVAMMHARVDAVQVHQNDWSYEMAKYDQVKLQSWMRKVACDIAERVGTYLTLGSQAKIADRIAEFLEEGL